MDMQQYRLDAMKTSNTYADANLRMAIAGMGLIGEVVELYALITADDPPSEVEICKEAGDVMWYIAAVATSCNLPMPSEDHYGATVDTSSRGLVLEAGALVDYLKKVAGHGHDLNSVRVMGHLIRLQSALHTILQTGYGMSLETVCEKNIAKLRARYPEGFSTERSVNRTE
jgi:NTP pyrophosphatase (non-canonical NTP hydrolase)